MGACPPLGFPDFCTDAIPKCPCHTHERGARLFPLYTNAILLIPGSPGEISPGLPWIFRHCAGAPAPRGDCLSRQTRRGPHLLSRLVHGLLDFAYMVRDCAKLGEIFGALLMGRWTLTISSSSAPPPHRPLPTDCRPPPRDQA